MPAPTSTRPPDTSEAPVLHRPWLDDGSQGQVRGSPPRQVSKFSTRTLTYTDREHLYRQHPLPTFCTRCGTTFTQDSELVAHSRLALACRARVFDPPDGFSKEEERMLRCKRKAAGCEENKWRNMYRVLFLDDEDDEMPFLVSFPTPTPSFLTPTHTHTHTHGLSRYLPTYLFSQLIGTFLLEITKSETIRYRRNSTTTTVFSVGSCRASSADSWRLSLPSSQRLWRTSSAVSWSKLSETPSLNYFSATEAAPTSLLLLLLLQLLLLPNRAWHLPCSRSHYPTR